MHIPTALRLPPILESSRLQDMHGPFLTVGQWLYDLTGRPTQITSLRYEPMPDPLRLRARTRMQWWVNDKPIEEWSHISLTLDLLESMGFPFVEHHEYVAILLPWERSPGDVFELRCYKVEVEKGGDVGEICYVWDRLVQPTLPSVAALQAAYLYHCREELTLKL